MSEYVDRVAGVHIFPIKSHHEATINGQLPSELTIGITGFEHNGAPDRGWVVKDETGLFVSQRGWDENHALKHVTDRVLATVQVDIQHDHLAVTCPGHGTLQVPIDAELHEETSVKIFGPELPALDAGNEAATYYSDLLGRAARLARYDPKRPRYLPEKYQVEGAANQSAGADGRPFSLASQASLDFLHVMAEMDMWTMPLSRFRASIEIDGWNLGSFFEDRVRKWRIGVMVAHTTKALERCLMTNVNQDTGVADRLATKLLVAGERYGWSKGDDQTSTAMPHFAQSLNHEIPAEEGQVVRVGDQVEALELERGGLPNFIKKG